MSQHFFRLAVDLDPAGNPVGASYEVHQSQSVRSIHVLPQPGPFDTVPEVVESLLEDVAARYGIVVPLPGL